MSEQERAKIDRFIAWLLEHPDKIPAFSSERKLRRIPMLAQRVPSLMPSFSQSAWMLLYKSDIRTLPYLCKYTNAQNFVQKS